jgi:predicted phage tail protein
MSDARAYAVLQGAFRSSIMDRLMVETERDAAKAENLHLVSQIEDLRYNLDKTEAHIRRLEAQNDKLTIENEELAALVEGRS